MRALLPILLTASLTNGAIATESCISDAMIVFDGSGSMAEMGFNDISEPRIFEARRAIAEVVPEVAASRKLGLVIYGPNGEDACSGLDLRFPPTANAAQAVIDAVETLNPDGSTPLTQAVKIAAEELQFRTRPAVVVLITDGKETCGGMPCMLATDLRNEGIETTVHVIGFKVRSNFFSWNSDDNRDGQESTARCLADTTGGTYTSAETLPDLVAALRVTLGCKLLF
jgi:Ca-activated chloride channel family protein